jgi:hypothetical protein
MFANKVKSKFWFGNNNAWVETPNANMNTIMNKRNFINSMTF